MCLISPWKNKRIGGCKSSKPGIYIQALQFASSRETLIIQELSNHLELTPQQERLLASQVHKEDIFHVNNINYLNDYENDVKEEKMELSMSVEDEFRLLEYTELKEARESSKRATWFLSQLL